MNKEDKETTIDLKELLQIFIKNWYIVIIVAAIFTGAVGLFTKYGITKKYESNTLIAVITSSSEDSAYRSDDFRVAVELAKRYSVISKSNQVISDVKLTLYNDYEIELSDQALKDSFTVSAVNDTDILQINVQLSNAEHAKVVAEVLTEKSREVYLATYQTKVDDITIIDHAVLKPVPVSPNLKLNLVIGFVLGVMISIGIILLKEFTNRKVRTQKDVEEVLGIPYFGSIPDMNKVKLI